MTSAHVAWFATALALTGLTLGACTATPAADPAAPSPALTTAIPTPEVTTRGEASSTPAEAAPPSATPSVSAAPTPPPVVGPIAAVKTQKGPWGYLKADGTWLFAPQFAGARTFSEGLAAVRIGERWGYIDTTGAVVIEPQFWYTADPGYGASGFSEGLALVFVGRKGGFIDTTGAWVLEPQWQGARDFRDGMALTFRRGDASVRFIDRTGALVMTPSGELYEGIFSEGLAAASRGGKWGFIDTTGAWAIPPRDPEPSEFHDGRALSCRGEIGDGRRCGYIDKTGRLVIPRIYQKALPFSEGLAAVTPAANNEYTLGGRRVGYIDTSGTWVIKPAYRDDADPFSEGLAFAEDSKTKESGYIDRSGKTVFEIPGMQGGEFSQGLATTFDVVDGRNEMGYVASDGTIIVPSRFAVALTVYCPGARSSSSTPCATL